LERGAELVGTPRYLRQLAIALGKCRLQKTIRLAQRRQRLASRRQSGDRFVAFGDGCRDQRLQTFDLTKRLGKLGALSLSLAALLAERCPHRQRAAKSRIGGSDLMDSLA
jgi:hypothetical protein